MIEDQREPPEIKDKTAALLCLWSETRRSNLLNFVFFRFIRIENIVNEQDYTIVKPEQDLMESKCPEYNQCLIRNRAQIEQHLFCFVWCNSEVLSLTYQRFFILLLDPESGVSCFFFLFIIWFMCKMNIKEKKTKTFWDKNTQGLKNYVEVEMIDLIGRFRRQLSDYYLVLRLMMRLYLHHFCPLQH